MKKITVKLTAIVLSVFIFVYGLCCSYVDIYAAETNYRFIDSIWNYNDSVAENLYQYIMLVMNVDLCALDPTILSEDKESVWNQICSDFLDYMNSDKGIELTEDEIPQYFEDNVSTVHESADGSIHGGGGMVLPDDLVDALHHTAQAILDEQSGYWLVSTLSVEDNIFVEKSISVDTYNALKQTFLNLKDGVFCYCSNDFYWIGSNNLYAVNPDKLFDPSVSNVTYLRVGYIAGDWSTFGGGHSFLSDGGSSVTNLFSTTEVFDSSKINSNIRNVSYRPSQGRYLASYDGHPVRIWKSVSDYKLWSVGKQPYYCTPEWVNYDYSQDNSMTLTNTYLGNVVNGGVVNNYYNVVQDAIDENNTDGTLTEDQIRDIVADTINRIQTDNNTDHSGDSGNSGNDDGSGGGIGAVIDGIGKFFDTLLTLVGKIIGMLSDFVNSVLTMFESFTVFTDGFSGFLTGAFGFIPPEAINVLVTGMTLLVILAIIKFLK